MRKILLATATALVIAITGLQGTALATAPDAMAMIVRQAAITIENDTEDDGSLSNMPEMSHDDADNDG
jgi:hypothetical protein